jgi:hypothetical protein
MKPNLETDKNSAIMKKLNLLYLTMLWIFVFTACTEDKVDIYHSNRDNIYFYFENPENNRILFSFADTTLDVVEVTLYLPVKISGNRIPKMRSFHLEVVDSLTTAQSGLHYTPLSDTYTMEADSGTFLLPVTLRNTDEIMMDSTLMLSLRLIDSEDFSTKFPHLIAANIIFSSRLEEPDWWKFWMSELGLYSRAKHYLFLVSSGTKALHNPSAPDGFMLTPKALYHISEYKAFLNNPFTWTENHPEYALDKQADNNYRFYLKTTPEKNYLLKWESSVGKYYFVDENGENILY